LTATTQAIYTLKTAESTIRGYIIAARGQPYERLDQLTVDLLLGAR